LLRKVEVYRVYTGAICPNVLRMIYFHNMDTNNEITAMISHRTIE